MLSKKQAADCSMGMAGRFRLARLANSFIARYISSSRVVKICCLTDFQLGHALERGITLFPHGHQKHQAPLLRSFQPIANLNLSRFSYHRPSGKAEEEKECRDAGLTNPPRLQPHSDRDLEPNACPIIYVPCWNRL